MERNRFGGDLIFVSSSSGEWRRPSAPTAVTFWDDDPSNASRNQWTDLATKDGTTTGLSEITSLSNGALPMFLGPPDPTVVAMWASGDGGTTGAWIYTSSKDTASTAGADPAGAAAGVQAALVNGAPSNLDTFGEVAGQMQTDEGTVSAHIANFANPHNVTKAQVGLGNVDNTSDANKPVSTAQGNADAQVLATATGRSIVNALIYGS